MSDKLALRKQLIYQLLCLFITFTVIFPILWVVGMSLDARNVIPSQGADSTARFRSRPISEC